MRQATSPLIRQSGSQPFAWYHGQLLTAQRFLNDAQRIAARLPEAGHMINLCDNRYHFCVVFAAALLRGQVSLLPASHTPNMVAQLKQRYPTMYCVFDGGEQTLDVPHLRLPDLKCFEHDEKAAFVVPMIDDAQLAAMVFTSGSTGEPQANRKTWGKLCLNAQAEALRMGTSDTHHIVATVPPQHMFGFESSVLLPWQAGGVLHDSKPFYPADVMNALAMMPEPRCLISTPFHLRNLIESQLPWPQVDTIVCATAPLSAELATQAEQAFQGRLMEIYGCTESGQLATRRTAQTEQWHAFDGAVIDQIGEDSFASGNYIEGRVLLSDVLLLSSATTFTLLGRHTDMVNIAGKRSSLAYLNQQLLSTTGVVDGVIFSPHDTPVDGVQRLYAFVVAPTLDKRALLGLLRPKIDDVFLPRTVYFVENIPRNSTGKITLNTLQAMVQERT